VDFLPCQKPKCKKEYGKGLVNPTTFKCKNCKKTMTPKEKEKAIKQISKLKKFAEVGKFVKLIKI